MPLAKRLATNQGWAERMRRLSGKGARLPGAISQEARVISLSRWWERVETARSWSHFQFAGARSESHGNPGKRWRKPSYDY